jgi:UDP-N-acetylmuramate-alanine ligase
MKEIYFAKDLEETYRVIEDIKKDNDLIIIMGAGNINKVKI